MYRCRQSRPDTETRGPKTKYVVEVTLKLAVFGIDVLGVMKQQFAMRRQLAVSSIPIKQSNTEICFESGDAFADGLLGNSKRSRGCGKAAVFDDIDEVSDLPDFHAAFHNYNEYINTLFC